MNMANTRDDDREFDYRADFEARGGKEKISRQRRMQYSQARRPSVTHNGIHRRRNKRFSW
jgi:hypothetical protein